ncbi:hypothetical protein CsSME_00043592 [Camellia sinensis var. sinensis]
MGWDGLAIKRVEMTHGTGWWSSSSSCTLRLRLGCLFGMLLVELHIHVPILTLQCNNLSAIAMANNLIFHARTSTLKLTIILLEKELQQRSFTSFIPMSLRGTDKPSNPKPKYTQHQVQQPQAKATATGHSCSQGLSSEQRSSSCNTTNILAHVYGGGGIIENMVEEEALGRRAVGGAWQGGFECKFERTTMQE